MSQSVGQTGQPGQVTNAHDAFEPYKSSAAWGCLATVVGTLINPVAGAAIAVYSVTAIGSNLIADHFNVGENNSMAKVARAAFISLVSIGAAFATICALTSSVVILTPALVGIAVSLVCLSILGAISSGNPSRSLAVPELVLIPPPATPPTRV